MKKASDKLSIKNIILFAATLILPLLILICRPLQLSLMQSGILAALVLTIIWWVTGVVERTVASIFLLLVFLLFSGAPIKTVFSFPLSENFILIAVSFLFSQGIANSRLMEKLLLPLLSRFARTVTRLILFFIISAIVMTFVIPQPFSRIIILSLIYRQFFDKIGLNGDICSTMMLGLYYFTVLLNIGMNRGDIILNGSLTSMAGVAVGEGEWMKIMLLPTLAYTVVAALLFAATFHKQIKDFPDIGSPREEKVLLSAVEKRNLAFLVVVIVFWATENLHGISGTIIVIVATAVMFPLGMLHMPDWKTINVKLLIFLTAAFSIGGTLKACGVADRLFSLFLPIFPTQFSLLYVLVVLVAAILLHTVLGSNIATMSVVVPGLMSIGAGVAPTIPLMFLICIAVCSQFLLPFHHVILLLGEGNGYYSSKQLLRLGIPSTLLTFAAVYLFYLPWWHIIGIL